MIDWNFLACKISNYWEFPIFREKLTHQNAIQRKENGHFVCRIHQNATADHIPFAIPFGFNRAIWPFKVMYLLRDYAAIFTIPKSITIWRIQSI
jgi:hypothetical protein